MTNLSQLYQSNLYNNFIPNIGFDEIKTNMDFEESAGSWRPVYQKMVDCGALPNNSTNTVAHSVSNISKIIKSYGMASDGTNYRELGHVDANSAYVIGLRTNTTNIYINTLRDYTSFTSSWVIVEYTKTTDVATSSPRNPLNRPNERVLGFFGLLTSDQTGLSDDTQYTVNLTAEVDPQSGWNSSNYEYTVSSEYDDMKCFATSSLDVNDISDGARVIQTIEIDTGSGYSVILRDLFTCATNGHWLPSKIANEYLGVVSTGDKIRLTGKCTAFNTDTLFGGDTSIRRTFMQLEFQP